MINAELLNRAGISYEAGMERFMKDAELYEAVITAFAGENIVERAQEAFDAGDHAGLLRVIHEAKGSGGNAGLDALYARASALVSLLRSEGYTDEELAESYQRFKETYLAARDAIRAALR